jgi:hypothetical protein
MRPASGVQRHPRQVTRGRPLRATTTAARRPGAQSPASVAGAMSCVPPATRATVTRA